MKKLLLLFVFIMSGNRVHAFDEHQAEVKFFEKELKQLKQKSKEMQQAAQELLMCVVNEKIRIAEEETKKRVPVYEPISSDNTTKNEQLVQEKSKVESEPNPAQIETSSDVKRIFTRREWAQQVIFENKTTAGAIAVGAGTVIVIGTWKIIKALGSKK